MGCAAPILRLGSSQIPEKRLVDALGPCLACLGCKYRLGSGSSKPFGNVDIPALVTLSQSSAVPVSKLGQGLSQEEDDEAIKTGCQSRDIPEAMMDRTIVQWSKGASL